MTQSPLDLQINPQPSILFHHTVPHKQQIQQLHTYLQKKNWRISIIFAIMYNSVTPDFYENNAHHKIGWIIVWMFVAQIASGMIRGVARYVNGPSSSRAQEIANEAEDMFMLGGDETDEEDDSDEIKRRPDERRKNSDSGNETGESTPRGTSTSSAPPSRVPYV